MALADAFNENLIGRAGTATPEELAVFAEHRKVMGLGEAACLAVAPVAGSEDRGDQPRRTAAVPVAPRVGGEPWPRDRGCE